MGSNRKLSLWSTSTLKILSLSAADPTLVDTSPKTVKSSNTKFNSCPILHGSCSKKVGGAVKIIFMAPALLLYDPEILRQLVEFTLDRFTFNGEVQDVGLPELKEEIINTLHEHTNFFYEIPKLMRDIRVYWISSLNLQLH